METPASRPHAGGADGFGSWRKSDAVAQFCGERVAEWGSGVLPGPAAGFAAGGHRQTTRSQHCPAPPHQRLGGRRRAVALEMRRQAGRAGRGGAVARWLKRAVAGRGLGEDPWERSLLKIPDGTKILPRWSPRDRSWYDNELTFALLLAVDGGHRSKKDGEVSG